MSELRPDCVLVITNPVDPHADAVIHFLYSLGIEVVRFHAAEMHLDCFANLNGTAGTVQIISSDRAFCLKSIRSCWYRRPDKVDEHTDHLSQPDRFLVNQETNATLWGMYGCMDTVWYSHPYNLKRAIWKLYQLRVASRLGFRVPDHIVSNDPTALGSFLQAHKWVVLKPIDERTTAIQIEDKPMSLFVRKFSSSDLEQLGRRKPPSPVHLQEYIEKPYDVRVTVIGQKVYPVAIKQPDSGEEVVDWRKVTCNLDHKVINCPTGMERRILEYMRHMGLNFAAFDFAVDKAGDWYFLECNPNGQWLWIEMKTGLELTKSFADHLSLSLPPLVESSLP